MKVHRAIIHPQTTDELVVHLPERFLNTEIEIIAFSVEGEPAHQGKRTYEQAVKFYRDNAVDFSKVEKWKREDLYE
jgi:hypothetical protein